MEGAPGLLLELQPVGRAAGRVVLVVIESENHIFDDSKRTMLC